MKPLLLVLLLFSCLCSKAQIIHIPDHWFKQILLQQYDSNHDGELQTAEALSITNLYVQSIPIFSGSGVTQNSPIDLSGIETFANLETLILDAPGTKYVNVSNLTRLRSIKLNGGLGYHNELTKLNVNGCTGLDSLMLEGENFFLDSLNLSSCTNLHFLQCNTLYRLGHLSLQGCINLKVLRLGMLGCGYYEIGDLVNLEEFDFGTDGLPVINWELGNFSNLRKVYISGAWISNLSLSQAINLDSVQMSWIGFSNESIDLSNASHLKLLSLFKARNIDNDSVNHLNILNLKNGSALEEFFLDSAFYFQYICADAFETDTFTQYFSAMGQHPTITSSCVFSPVPVKLEYFSIAQKNNTNVLNWKANCTYGNASFVIERSNDAVHFSAIGNISATALRCQLPFNFTDNNPVAGKNYYRIKITDADGKSFYSKVLVAGNSKAGIAITAVVNNTVYISSNKQQTVTVKVIAIDGKELLNKKQSLIAGNNTIPLPLHHSSKGIYTLVVYTGEDIPVTTKVLY